MFQSFQGVRSAAFGCLVAIATAGAASAQSTELSDRAKALDADGNGTIEKSEARGPLAANFDTIDKNSSGSLDGAEISAFFGGGGNAGGPPPATVVIDEVTRQTIGQTTPVVGRFVVHQAGPVAARIGGSVIEMDVFVGNRVAEGALIAVLDHDRLALERDRIEAVVTQQRAQLSAAQADLAKRRNELKRLEGIRKSAAFSQARYDDMVQDVTSQRSQVAETQAQLVQAETQLKRAERDLSDAEIRAPFPGVISETHTEVGSYLSVGSPVVTIINDTALDIEADVPSGRLEGIEPGTVVSVRLDSGALIQANVRAIVPSENPRTRTRPVRFTPDLSNGGAFADNQSVTVLIPVGDARTAVTVAKDAVIERNGAMSVFVVRNGAAATVPVTIGEGVGDRFIVTSGLSPGDKVVIRGNEGLRPGQRLNILGANGSAARAPRGG